jgi:hypothetical protein
MREVLFFRPRSGAFDVADVEGYVERLGHAFRDPADPHTFIVYADKAAADHFHELRQRAPDERRPFTLLITVGADTIRVTQLADWPELALAKQFVEWLLQRCDCIVEDDDGHDVTAVATTSLDELYPKPVRAEERRRD